MQDRARTFVKVSIGFDLVKKCKGAQLCIRDGQAVKIEAARIIFILHKFCATSDALKAGTKML